MEDHSSVYNAKHRFILQEDMGGIFPLEGGNSDEILLVVSDQYNQAVLVPAYIAKNKAHLFPLKITPHNIAMLANKMHGQAYGWGGLSGLRDCSSTIKDLFTPFGIWLPQNSSRQAIAGHFISLGTLSDLQKINVIKNKGLPFLTLIWLPGHIVLYVGSDKEHVYFYENIWGFHRINWLGKKSRALIGGNVIMPGQLGKHYFNVTKIHLTASQGMTILVPPP